MNILEISLTPNDRRNACDCAGKLNAQNAECIPKGMTVSTGEFVRNWEVAKFQVEEYYGKTLNIYSNLSDGEM